jgi:hypothetical protein
VFVIFSVSFLLCQLGVPVLLFVYVVSALSFL